jgi:hypothetical protein
MSNNYFLRRGNEISEPEQLETEIRIDDHSSRVNAEGKREQLEKREGANVKQRLRHQSLESGQRRMKNEKKRKRTKRKSKRRDNIFNRHNQGELFTTESTIETDSTEFEALPTHRSSRMSHMSITDRMSKHTSPPIERDVPIYNPILTPTVTPFYSDNDGDSQFSSTEAPRSRFDIDLQGNFENPTATPLNDDNDRDDSQSSSTQAPRSRFDIDSQGKFENPGRQFEGPPTLAPVRLPTRQDYANPPTRNGIEESDGYTEDRNYSIVLDPCDSDDDRTTGRDRLKNKNEHDIAIGPENTKNYDKNVIPIVPDDRENNVDADTTNDVEIIANPVSDGQNGISSVKTQADKRRETWKYVLVIVGCSCLLFIVLAIFLRSRSRKSNAYGYAVGKDGTVKIEKIDNTIPLDQTSGYSRMNSAKSFNDLEDMKPTQSQSAPEFRRESYGLHEQSTPVFSRTQSSIDSDSEGEEKVGNIDSYTDDDDNNTYDDDDVYSYDYEIEETETEEVDELDVEEESTLSWEEEEYLSTIDEEDEGGGSHFGAW